MKADEMQARPRHQHQRGQPLHELHWRHHDVLSAVAVRCFEFENDLPRAVQSEGTHVSTRITLQQTAKRT